MYIKSLARAFVGLCLLFGVYSNSAWAFSPEEVFETGKQAFDLGHWEEAYDAFSRFNDMWPTHKLHPQSTMYYLLCESRSGLARVEKSYKEQLAASLTVGLAYLRKTIPDADFTELEVELQILKSELFPTTASLPAVLQMPPETLLHFMRRKVLPEAAENPMFTLQWIHDWELRYGKKAPKSLAAALNLWKARALWRVLLSPLAAQKFDSKIQSLEKASLPAAYLKAVKIAFRDGDADVKREAAILGLSATQLTAFLRYDLCFLNEYKIYLNDRGISLECTWVPR